MINYIEEKIWLVLWYMIFILLQLILMFLIDMDTDFIILSTILYIVLLITYLALSYINIKRKNKKIIDMIDHLEEKYLAVEMIKKPKRLENEAYYYDLKKSSKAMNDKLTELQHKYQDYEEYIESFVHEIKSPISVISLIGDNENNQIVKEETRKIDDLCEQILFFSRTKNPENDYFIKKINLEDVIHKTLIDYKNIILKNKIKIEVKDTQKIVYTDKKWLKFIIKQILQNGC